MPTRNKRCFVIMPFSKTTDGHTEEYWTKQFENYLRPLIEESPDVEAVRSEPLRGDILRQIISDLVSCPIVVADLTDNNPNVYWEMGVRQSFKHGTITIAQEGTRIPFDLSVKGILFYCDEHIKNAEFERKFRAALTDCLSYPNKPDSHVLEAISGRGTLFEIFRRDEATRRLEALISERDHNKLVLDRIYKKIEGETVVTARLRTSSTELLITNRYLDEDSSFYEFAELYFDFVHSMNEALILWLSDGARFKKWSAQERKDYYEVFEDYAKALDNAKKKLQEIR